MCCRCVEGLYQGGEATVVDDHGFVGQHMKPGLQGLEDIGSLFPVVTGQHNRITCLVA